ARPPPPPMPPPPPRLPRPRADSRLATRPELTFPSALSRGPPPEGLVPALGRLPPGRAPAPAPPPGRLPAPGPEGRLPTLPPPRLPPPILPLSPPGLSTCSPPRPRKSMRLFAPPRRSLLPNFWRTSLLPYLTPWRCSGRCCQLLPPPGRFPGLLILILLLFQLTDEFQVFPPDIQLPMA